MSGQKTPLWIDLQEPVRQYTQEPSGSQEGDVSSRRDSNVLKRTCKAPGHPARTSSPLGQKCARDELIMAGSSEDSGGTFSMDAVSRASGQALAVVSGSDTSSLTEGDLAILNRLQFLADKVELLERKLDNTLYNVGGSSDTENFAQDYGVINSFQVNVLTGPNCTQNDCYSGEDEADKTALVTREMWEDAETEQTTSFLIIPVGNNKEHEDRTLQSEKQTLLAPKANLALPGCIASDETSTAEVVPSVGAIGYIDRTSTRTNLPRKELLLPSTSAESENRLSETPNQTMFSTASIELAPCLPSPSIRVHELDTDGASERSLCDLDLSSNSSGNRASTASGQRHSLTFGYTIGLATAKAAENAGRPSGDGRTNTAKCLDLEYAVLPPREETEQWSRSVGAMTLDHDGKFQYHVATSGINGPDAIADARGREFSSEGKLNTRRLAEKTIKSDFQLSKQRREAGDFIDSPSDALYLKHKPGWSLDENHNHVKDSGEGLLEREERGRVLKRFYAISEDVHAKANGEGLMTNGSGHYDRSWGNYDQSKSAQIDMQMRPTAGQRNEVARGTVRPKPQAVNHSPNNSTSEKFVNSHRMPAVYNSVRCVNNQASVSEDSSRSISERCYATNGTGEDRLGSAERGGYVNGSMGRVTDNRGTTNTRTQVPSEGSLSRQAAKLRPSDGGEEYTAAAQEQSFEEQLRNLIDPEVISPTLAPETALTSLQRHQTFPENRELERLSSADRSRRGMSSPNTEKERWYGAHRGNPAHPSAGRGDSSSDSPYSSLTSVSSALDQSADNSTLLDSGNAFSPRGLRYEERVSNSPSVSFISTDFSSTADSDAFRSFRLSPLSLNKQRVLSPLHCVDLSGPTPDAYQLSSPTSSLDTSDVSVIDSFTDCECVHECECQTGIPTQEDFIEELKTISKHVLNARQNAQAPGSKTPARYFLDDECGEMDTFSAQARAVKTKGAVPMLVKVILRLRKHFFGTVDSAAPSKPCESPKPRETSPTLKGPTKRGRRISFSPSAVLLSAIGENAASEVKEVIEKEKLDVNQLSPSGRSLLHKAAASGDLESIHTLVQHGARVNILDQDGFPPLHSALRKAHYKCAIFLLECGADLTSYTAARVHEFVHITELAESWFGSEEYEQSFQESKFNTAL